MVEVLDINNKEKKLEKALEFLRKGGITVHNKPSAKPITERNIELILDYYKIRSLEGKSLGTRFKEIHMLVTLARLLGKDFDTASKDELKDLILKIDSCGSYAPWSKAKFRLLVRQFYKWIKYGDEYQSKDSFPEEVGWIKNSFKKRDEPKISTKELITEEQMRKLIDAADHPRDKAFMSMLTESGARIAEIGNLRIKDVYQDEFSYLIHIKGKTGERTDRVFYSDAYIAQWLNIHPLKNNPDAPLWINFRGQRQMKYPALVRLINKIWLKSGLQGRHNPHLFRHSRVTIRDSSGFNLSELSLRCGCSESLLEAVENSPMDYHNIGINMLDRLANILGSSLEDIFKEGTSSIKPSTEKNIRLIERVAENLNWSSKEFFESRDDYLMEMAAKDPNRELTERGILDRHQALQKRRFEISEAALSKPDKKGKKQNNLFDTKEKNEDES